MRLSCIRFYPKRGENISFLSDSLISFYKWIWILIWFLGLGISGCSLGAGGSSSYVLKPKPPSFARLRNVLDCDELLNRTLSLHPKIMSWVTSSAAGKCPVVFMKVVCPLAYKRSCSFLKFMGLMLQSALRCTHFSVLELVFLIPSKCDFGSGVSLGLSRLWTPLAEDASTASLSSLGSVTRTVPGPCSPGTTRVGCSTALQLQHSTVQLEKCHLYQLKVFLKSLGATSFTAPAHFCFLSDVWVND